MSELDIARAVALTAHYGQTRKDGQPYHTHCEAVANAVRWDLQPAAWLHDVLEDTKVCVELLEEAGLSDYTIGLVQELTYHENYGRTKSEWLWKMLDYGDPDVLEIKLADMRHNLSGLPSPSARARYEEFIPLFAAALELK